MKHTMLHMKLKMAVCSAALLAFLPTSALAGVCFLPDCSDEDLAGGGGNMDMNEDTAFCESKGFTYYASGKCPQYYAVVSTCSRDDHYLKCDAKTWCEQNGYNTTTCSIPQYVNDPCPSYGSLYKGCKTDNDRACKETGYTNTCPSGQKLKKESGRCSYDSSYGTCCTPSGCPSYTSTNSSSYGTNGTDGCEYTCYYTCNMNCPSTHPYSSDPTGCSDRTTNGCGNKSCYNYKSCCTPSCSDTTSSCSCGSYTISDGCGGTCRRCESCCTSSSSNWCSVHSTCHGDCCSDGTIDSCDPQCGGSGCSSSGSGSGGNGGCSKHYTWQYGYVSNGGADYVYSVQCVCSDGSSRDLGTETIWDSCWRCDAAHLTCKANCGKSCYHGDPYYASSNNIIDYGSRDVCTTFVSGSC